MFCELIDANAVAWLPPGALYGVGQSGVGATSELVPPVLYVESEPCPQLWAPSFKPPTVQQGSHLEEFTTDILTAS